MSKKIFFEEEKTVVKKQRGYIEVDTDFTQVYDCFDKLCIRLKSISSVKIMFWLLSHETNKNNTIGSNKFVYQRFNQHLIAEGAETISDRTFQASIEELHKNNILTKVARGMYYFNPHVFWRDDKNKRVQFIIDEKKDGNYESFNPIQKKVGGQSKKNLTNKK
jgi:hypothetical protein